MQLWDYIGDNARSLTFLTYQHASLSFQTVLVGTLVAIAVAALVYRLPLAAALTLTSSRVALTIPSLALLALLIVPFGLGVTPSFLMLAFFAMLPVIGNAVVGLRSVIGNAVVGLRSVPPAVVESARGIGLSRWRILLTVELPIAWPVILTGIRVSTQMIVGVAAIVAYVLGPGLGSLIFNGLARLGGANALESALAGTLLIVVIALVFDALLVLLGRLTISKGLS
ncbi:ABC transporter permease [Gordonia alkanivorans]|uniref:ABC transporter permease n=1 Tax=Gordonia alkanivorans TaxID=84096 RepID=UPI00244BF410|nr:ABC transporter permease [Gordonia alkanivorans]MDH3022892.1 ABC transporter permease [Gordonia alkanivorans]